MPSNAAELAKSVMRRNVRSAGQRRLEIVQRTFLGRLLRSYPAAGWSPRQSGRAGSYKRLRTAFPDLTPQIYLQTVDGDGVTTFNAYQGTHQGEVLCHAVTGTHVRFETIDAMKVCAPSRRGQQE